MARDRSPILKRCRTLELAPQTLGINKKSKRNPRRSRRKESEYGRQLKAKQKAKFVYGVMEKQFRSTFGRAAKMPGKSGENLMKLLELRLDNVVYRLGFASTRAHARQLVNHGHFTVDGKKVNIPSFQVKPGMEIAVKEKSLSSPIFTRLTGEDAPIVNIPEWLERDKNALKGKVLRMPTRDDVDFDVEEHLIVEYYSK